MAIKRRAISGQVARHFAVTCADFDPHVASEHAAES